MDPDETLKALSEALNPPRSLDAARLKNVLRLWLERGGFHPKWHAYPRASRYFWSGRKLPQTRLTSRRNGEA